MSSFKAMGPVLFIGLLLGACDPGTASSGTKSNAKEKPSDQANDQEKPAENEDSPSELPRPSGDDQDSSEGGVHHPHCEVTEIELEDLDLQVEGRTLKEIIDASTGSFDGVWTSLWKKEQWPTLNIEPDCDGDLGQLKVGYSKGKIIFAESKFIDCDPGVDCDDVAITCLDQFEIVVDVELHSENGALNESWSGRLVIDDPRDPDFEEHQLDKEPEERGPLIRVKRDKIDFDGDARLEVSSEKNIVTRHSMEVDVRIEEGELKLAQVDGFIEMESKDGETASMATVELFRFQAQDLAR